MTLGLFINYLSEDPVLYVSVIVAVVISIVLHELGHGVAAIWQGDDTPRVTGHMTLNPAVHMPPFSWILLLLAGITYGLMPVNPSRFRSRFGNAMVAAAGPAVNLVLAFLSLTALGLWWSSSDLLLVSGGTERAMDFLFMLGRLNLILVAINLMPIPPLDGSTVLADFSPGFRRLARDPNNQPLFMGAFVLFFVFADKIWDVTDSVVFAYLRLFLDV